MRSRQRDPGSIGACVLCQQWNWKRRVCHMLRSFGIYVVARPPDQRSGQHLSDVFAASTDRNNRIDPAALGWCVLHHVDRWIVSRAASARHRRLYAIDQIGFAQFSTVDILLENRDRQDPVIGYHMRPTYSIDRGRSPPPLQGADAHRGSSHCNLASLHCAGSMSNDVRSAAIIERRIDQPPLLLSSRCTNSFEHALDHAIDNAVALVDPPPILFAWTIWAISINEDRQNGYCTAPGSSMNPRSDCGFLADQAGSTMDTCDTLRSRHLCAADIWCGDQRVEFGPDLESLIAMMTSM